MVVTFVISVSVSFHKPLPSGTPKRHIQCCLGLGAALITEQFFRFSKGFVSPAPCVWSRWEPVKPDPGRSTIRHGDLQPFDGDRDDRQPPRGRRKTRLVRVGAYFHDIGKAIRPEYFTENQQHGVDPHTGLKPKRSSEIIISHIKDGVSMAENNYKLPKQVVDLIKQHHGTFPVSYFYEKAKAECEKNGEPELSIDEFRYPGPIPQSKEAAILMIADAIESASQT